MYNQKQIMVNYHHKSKVMVFTINYKMARHILVDLQAKQIITILHFHHQTIE